MVSLAEAPQWVWMVVLLVIFGAVGVLILDEFAGTLTENSTAWTATVNGTEAIANVMKQLNRTSQGFSVLNLQWASSLEFC